MSGDSSRGGKPELWAFHGFLGRGEDWLPWAWKDFWNLNTPSLGMDRRHAGLSLTECAREWGRDLAVQSSSSPFLIGYSMGGRLALRLLLEFPGLFKGAVLVSTSPGLEGEELRRRRLEADEEWAQRFESEDWESLMTGWDSLPVFAQASSVSCREARREDDFNRKTLAEMLRAWSPGREPSVWSRLHEIHVPVLWVTGALDAPYCAQADRALSLLPKARGVKVEGAGHRVPWEQPDRFGQLLKRFVAHAEEGF